ncbi:peptidoglycan-binding protein [Streptomyces sp. BBFR102]|uniref:peptidoglycan-binding domain-containing protein n=1 Tax=Streptomyces sp. BBFR102 TaxID=3448171 RepID=UPI003F538731
MSRRCAECGDERPEPGQGTGCACASGTGTGAEGGHRERVRPYLGPHAAGAPPVTPGQAYGPGPGRAGEGAAGPGHACRPAGTERFATPDPEAAPPPPHVGAVAAPGQALSATAPLPKVSDLALFPPDQPGAPAEERYGAPAPDVTPPPSTPRPRRTAARSARRRRAALLGVAAGAVVVVALAGAVATDSLPAEEPEERALPTPSATAPHTFAPGPATPSASASEPPASAAPSATSASAPPSGSPGGGEPATSPVPAAGPDGPPAPKPSATRRPSEPSGEPSPDRPPQAGPVLRRGDSGPRVRELQQRLQQLHLYRGPAHGDFGRRLEDALRVYQWARGLHDSLGVYDEPTRRQLESETTQP